MKKKSQAWGIDLAVASFIFLFAILAFYLYSLNYTNPEEETLQVLQHEGGIVSDALLSEGSPPDWTESEVIRIGLLSDEKINQTKLERFNAFVDNDYNRTKIIFGVKHDYLINFSSPVNLGGEDVYGIGFADLDSDNVIQTRRISTYDSKPITLTIYLVD